MTEQAGKFPFAEQPGAEIERGYEFRVLRHQEGWVVKEGIHPTENTFERLKQDKQDYDLMRRHIGKFLPETQHLRGHNAEGKPCNIIRQREIKGRPLFELTEEELMQDEVRLQLIELFEGCSRMWDGAGQIPDLCGPWKSWLSTFKEAYDPRYARNIMVEEGSNKVWLVDTAAWPIVFSKKAALQYKPRLALMRHNAAKFLKGLTRKRI